MQRLIYTAITAIATLYMAPVMAQEKPTLVVTADGISNDGVIHPDFAFCVQDAKNHVKEGHNRSVGLNWSKGPDETKSYAIIAIDTDVPTIFDDAGKKGKTLPASMKRKDFYHWVLFDIPPSITSLPAGADSHEMSKNGKSETETQYGRRGINDYAAYFAANPERSGIYAGYDGPCPPWNDEMVHHYHFKVFALDVPSLGLPKKDVGGATVMKLVKKHTIAEGEIVGKYTLNPTIKP